MQAFALLLLSHWHFSWDANQALRRAIAEADRSDPGWRWEDLSAKRAKLPDDKNGTLQLLKIGTALKDWTPFRKTLRFPNERKIPGEQRDRLVFEFEMALDDLPSQARLNQQQSAALSAELAEIAPALQLARELKRFSMGRYPYPRGASLLAHNDSLPTARIAARLLAWDASLHAERGQPNEALKSCEAILAAATIIGDEVDQRAQLLRVAVRWIACLTLERILAQGEPGPKDLLRIQQGLDREAKVNVLLDDARADRAFLHRVFAAHKAGQISDKDFEWFEGAPSSVLLLIETIPARQPRVVSPLQRAAAVYSSSRERAWGVLLKEENAFVEMAKLPPSEVLAKLRALAAEREYAVHLGFVYTTGLHSRFPRIALRDHMRVQTARTAIALERYRQKNGGWPKKLEDLVPDFLSVVPTDCFTTKPLRYRQLKDGVVVYSAAGRKDHGGRLRADPGEVASDEDLDVGFRLWNANARRQPPLPPLRIPE
jgi:hypothetical protein